MESNCACGNESGTNDECERCRLIDQLKAAQNRVGPWLAGHPRPWALGFAPSVRTRDG